MQPVGADNQIGLARRSLIEANPHALPRLLDTREGVAEDRLDLPIQGAVDRGRQIGAPQGGEAAIDQAPNCLGRETAALVAMPVHEAHLSDLVTQLSDAGEQAHLVGDVVADPPEVEDVTAAAKLWRRLDEHDLMTAFSQ